MLVAGAAASTRADPGVTPTTIVLGIAEPDSAYGRGAAAYFRFVNARGGVNGRSIVIRPEGPDVFAVFDSVELFGEFRLSPRAEGWILGSYLARTRRGAGVAVLYADDEEGRELLAGLRQGIARSTVGLVVAQPWLDGDDADSAARDLQATGADTLALFIRSPAAPARAMVRNGWRPALVARSAAPGVQGAVSLSFAKDPRDPAWRDDPGLRRHRSALARADEQFVEGMAAAYELVRVLRAAGKTPTRAAVVAAIRNLRDASNPFLLPGVVVRTSPADRFPVEQARLRRYTQAGWRGFGGLWTHRR